MSIVTAAKSMARVRGKGWRPSEERESDLRYTPRLSAKRDGAPRLRECVPVIFRQGATSSCVVQAIGGAVGTHERWLGIPFTQETHGISRRDLYYRSRYTHGDHTRDEGTYIPSALDQMRKHGVALESQFPWSELWINRGAPAVLLHAGYERSGLVYERIIASGDAKLEALAAAFAEGLPVIFGAQLPESFTSHVGEQVYSPRAAEGSIGGHAMYAVEIDPLTGDVLVVNSWGRGWGFGGMGWMSSAWVKNAWRDLHVIRGWRRVHNAERIEASNA